MTEACWALELRPQRGDLPAERADEILPQADAVALTGRSLINHACNALIRLCCPGSLGVMLGPSTPLAPVLFDFGIDVLIGTVGEDADGVLRSISQGAAFRQIKRGGGLRLLTMTRQT